MIDATMASRNLQDVALDAIVALKNRKKFKQVEIAARLKTTDAAVSETLAGKRRLTLRFLEAVGEVCGIHPGELLLDPHRDEMKIVSGVEMQLLRYFRSWPAPTREALLTFAAFFADEDPVTYDQRVAHEQLRQLPAAKRRVAYAYLTFLTEGFFPGGDLPPDIRKGLGLPETDAPQSTRTQKATTRKTTTTKA